MKILISYILLFVSGITAQETIKFMVVSDTHYYSPSPNFTESVLYEITMAAIEEEVEFIFFTGDLIIRDYPEGENIDSLLADWKFVLDTLDVNGVKVYACRGNNDVNGGNSWADLFSGKYTLPDNGPEGEKYYTYSFEYDSFLFISLDQYTEYNSINQEWLDNQLLNNTKPFVFAAGHVPAFKVFHNGMAANPENRNVFWTSLTNNNGKIYFCGHDHFYDHSILNDEDENPYNDVHHIIVGTGGGGFHHDSEYNGDNGNWTPTRIFHENAYGYVLVEVNRSDLITTWKHRLDTNDFVEGGDTYSYIVSDIDPEIIHFVEYELLQNYPNPFNPSTKISYSISTPPQTSPYQGEGNREELFVSIIVYDILGHEITTFVNEYQNPGYYEVVFNAGNLASGIYLYKLKVYPEVSGAGSFIQTKKMLMLK
ncbi:hypothetical protein ACFLS9_04585 [Bacteroidota bacterium]